MSPIDSMHLLFCVISLTLSSDDVASGIHMCSRPINFSLRLRWTFSRVTPRCFGGPKYLVRVTTAPLYTTMYSLADYYFYLSVNLTPLLPHEAQASIDRFPA